MGSTIPEEGMPPKMKAIKGTTGYQCMYSGFGHPDHEYKE
jgi:hypothetical protein